MGRQQVNQPHADHRFAGLAWSDHNGGTILFGPDGKLYIVIGDLNRNGQLQNFSGGDAPDDTGVILRLNDDGSAPGDKPFSSQADLAKYYAYGVRNGSSGAAPTSITNDFKLGSAACWGQQGVDPCHNGVFNEILAARFALQDRQLLQDDNALF
jgi:hypothetical protein